MQTKEALEVFFQGFFPYLEYFSMSAFKRCIPSLTIANGQAKSSM
ncbi:hypothetical protein [Ligilactobacillus equi]|nr:hypothetical protein [Ligilactobacillus equi]